MFVEGSRAPVSSFFEDRRHSQRVDGRENRITALGGWRAWSAPRVLEQPPSIASHRGNLHVSAPRLDMPWFVRASCSGFSSWTHSLFVNPGLVRLLLSDVRRHCSNRIGLASSARPLNLAMIFLVDLK